MDVCTESIFTHGITICATQRNKAYSRLTSSCVHIEEPSYSSWRSYNLPPGGNVTVHFHQLVVAEKITISRTGFLTLCEVDVLGTRVVLAPEG